MPLTSKSKGVLFAVGAVLGLQLIWMAVAYFRGSSPASPPRDSAVSRGYMGDAACLSCHAQKVDSYYHTAHAATSSLPSAQTIHGSFAPGADTLETVNPDLSFVMQSTPAGFFQTALMQTASGTASRHQERFDLVIGSGRKGQTYLFWHDDQLFELPVAYWTELGEWMNNPGYIDGVARFDRPIAPRCLECHASFFESRQPPINRFNREGFVLGVSCERCHGPGAEHIALYQSATPPKKLTASAIINPARLPRNRQMDSCALCHGGSGTSTAPALSYKVGDVLSDFVILAKPLPNAPVDVHGNQVELLKRSRCFRSSKTMTCITCHDVHEVQRDPVSFVARCLTCHAVENCGKFTTLGHAIDLKCIDCHMPLQQTAKIILSVKGMKVQPKVRNHQIGIYPGI